MEKIKGFINLAMLFLPALGFLLCCAALNCMNEAEPFVSKFISGIILILILPAVAFIREVANV
jgi:hypothetical protein